MSKSIVARTVLVVTLVICSSLALCPVPASGESNGILFKEDFNDLSEWKDLHFRKINAYTQYSVVQEGSARYLKAESNASASGITLKKEFKVRDYPVVEWRWKISNVYENGNALHKSGDDYPIRIYVMFKYDPDSAPLGKRLKYAIAKRLYGEYPPHSSLNYIWANRHHDVTIIPNAYADKAQMVVLQAGADNAGKWVKQEVDIIEDYRQAFCADPPDTASLAIMNDSDNTKESSVSYVDYIIVRKK